MAEQVGKFLTELPELETPTDGDLMYIVDDETTSKKVTMANLKRVLGGNVTGTVEDASVSFSDGADGIPMEECEVTIVPTQDLHGYSKPWAGGAGKNKLDFTDTTVTSSRTIASDISLTAGSYIIAFDIKNNSNIGGYYQVRIGATSIGGVNFGANYSGRLSKTFTLSEDSVINILVAGASSGYSFEFSNGQIEVGSTATSYEPYSNICPISGHTDVTITVSSTSGGSGDDTTVSLGRTVYGGSLDVTTGELTVDRTLYDLKTQSFAGSSAGGLSWHDYSVPSDYETNNVLSDKLQYVEDTTDAWRSNIPCYTRATDTTIRVYGTVALFTTGEYADSTLYIYATPQTYTLSKEQIQTHLGQNYVRHDGGGNIKVVYIRDLDIVINDLIDRVTALENE